jgi:hypothetical protein
MVLPFTGLVAGVRGSLADGDRVACPSVAFVSATMFLEPVPVNRVPAINPPSGSCTSLNSKSGEPQHERDDRDRQLIVAEVCV